MILLWYWPEKFLKSLIERTGKAAFQASDLSLKPSRPLLIAFKIDQELFYSLKVDLMTFKFF